MGGSETVQGFKGSNVTTGEHIVPIAALNDEQLESMQNEIYQERQKRMERAVDRIRPSLGGCDAMKLAEAPAPATTAGPTSLSLDNVVDAFRYQPWTRDQAEAGSEVVDALIFAAKVILRRVPAGADRSVALRKLREARMDANSAITHRGRF